MEGIATESAENGAAVAKGDLLEDVATQEERERP